MVKKSLFRSALAIAPAFAFFLGACTFVIKGDDDTFVAVTNITGVPAAAAVGTPLALTGTVTPWNATNKTIVWTVKDAETTGALITGNSLTTTAAGTVTVTAEVVNGLTASSPYTKDFLIAVSVSAPAYIPVTGITDVPTIAIMGRALTLSGTVEPSTAANKTIVWSGSGVSNGILTATNPGTWTVTATIENGATESSPYTGTFNITAYDAGSGGSTLNPFGTDSIPFYWAQDDAGGYVYVEVMEDSWISTVEETVYNSGTYSRIGEKAAQWAVAGGIETGSTGLAFIDNTGTMLVGNLANKFSDMNGTFTKLDTGLPLQGTWKTSEPSNDGTYMKIVSSAGIFTTSVSPNGSSWWELMRGTYPTTGNPAVCTVTEVNTGDPAGDKISIWTSWESLTEAQKTSLDLFSNTLTVIVYTDRCEVRGQTFYKQP